MTVERKTFLSQAGLIVGFVVSILLAVQLMEARFLAPLRKCQDDQEARIRVLETAISRQAPILEALGRRLNVDIP